jgi:hypothetical protein
VGGATKSGSRLGLLLQIVDGLEAQKEQEKQEEN